MTRLDEIVEAGATAVRKLEALSHGAYARRDVAEIVTVMGMRLEDFIRGTIFPKASRRDDLATLISRLPAIGMEARDADALHDLRKLYNISKHDPSTPLLVASATATITGAMRALRSLSHLAAGVALAPIERELNYHLWVGFWDQYHSGDTEIAVMLPFDPATEIGVVDVFHVNIGAWDRLKPLLSGHQRFRFGEKHFKSEVWQSFRAQEDFLDAGIWDGDYGELARLLARFDDREISLSLLPSVARRGNPVSFGTALVIASVDVARAAATQPTIDELTLSVLERANAEYALPSVEPVVRAAASQLARLLTRLPFNHWRQLAGPVLVRVDRAKDIAFLRSGPLNLALDENAVVLGV